MEPDPDGRLVRRPETRRSADLTTFATKDEYLGQQWTGVLPARLSQNGAHPAADGRKPGKRDSRPPKRDIGRHKHVPRAPHTPSRPPPQPSAVATRCGGGAGALTPRAAPHPPSCTRRPPPHERARAPAAAARAR
eukprot:6534298-Prymnesium_polylepis.1